MYDKGAQVVHMIRMMINNDSSFRQLLRGLNKDFYHRIVSSKEVEDYISKFVGKELKSFFDVYLRSTIKPTLEWYADDTAVHYQWNNALPDFRAPVKLQLRSRHGYMTTSRYGYFNYSGLEAKNVSVLPAGWYDVVEKGKK
jgi:aminopeptidase N